jgi:NADPH-dependent 2,4-dienoyl-CoA reductase/sulfur reductase-like enzyme
MNPATARTRGPLLRSRCASRPAVLLVDVVVAGAGVLPGLLDPALDIRLERAPLHCGTADRHAAEDVLHRVPANRREPSVAVGRRPSTAGLGLKHYGINGRAVSVDARMRAADGLRAAGDVTGLGAFTHLAVHQGRIAATDILGNDHPPEDYTALPRVTFTDPEIGSVGLTEAAARAGVLDALAALS